MSGAALDNPLVREYLREMDAALARLPAGQGSELREQITAHITDALAPDAADEQVAAVLARLGSPAELAAEASGSAADPGGRRDDAASRPSRRISRPWRNWRIWVAAGIGVAAVVVASQIIAAETAPALITEGAMGWWYPQDRARQVDTSADSANQSTVPIRSGQRQGFFINLFNDSDQTQTVLGPASGNGLPTAFIGAEFHHGVIGVSTPNRVIDGGGGGGEFSGVKFVLPGVIPPHQFRTMRVLWISNACLESKGDEVGSDEVALSVRVGWITRTEIISLTQGWFVAGPSTGKYARSAPACRFLQPPRSSEWLNGTPAPPVRSGRAIRATAARRDPFR